MFRQIFNYFLKKDNWIGKVFHKRLPENAFIDKGRCAIGGTTLETKYKKRTSIIIVSNIGIILNKQFADEIEERPDYVVYGDVTQSQVNQIIKKVKLGDKIMSTPEGIRKIMRAASKTGRLAEVYKEWFLLLDECHTFITENYREDILAPFEFFWKFEKKSIISATPYYFSDPRVYTLDLHKIEFTEPLNTVTIVNAISVDATLNYILKEAVKFPGNLHIFYNSVTAIKQAVVRSGIQDCHIYCAGNEKNLSKLGDLQHLYCPQPSKDNFKKVNFHTSRGFEGWDLKDENATVILVTDFRKPHTAIGIGNKGKQAIGRPRNPIHRILHITNHKCRPRRLKLEDYIKAFNADATELISNHNQFIKTNRTEKLSTDPRLKYFADVDKKTKYATLNTYKLDQQINEAASKGSYQHIKFIIEDWKAAYFDVELKQCKRKLESKTQSNRKSSATILREDYTLLKEYYSQEKDLFIIGDSTDEIIKKRNPIAYDAYHQLSESLLNKVKFNFKKVKNALTIKSNANAETKASRLIKSKFQINQFYFNSDIVSTLQKIYNNVKLIDPKTGQIKVASPIQLDEVGRFIIKKGRRVNSVGVKENGYYIVDHNLGLKVTE